MEELKFKMWDKITQKMETVSFLDLESGIAKYVRPDGYTISRFINKECDLLKYIGLKDKNGKEIYEGDIVKIAYDSICIVDFHAGQFVFNITNPDPRTGGKRWCNESIYFNLQSEIIGNIYENPNLLKQK